MANRPPAEIRLLGRTLGAHRPAATALDPFVGLGRRSAAAQAAALGLGPRTPLNRAGRPLRPLEGRLGRLRLDRTLRRWEQLRIQAKRRLGSAPGRRHDQGLPVRGQRTHSNGRTARRLLRRAP
jgi:small subunit ribosomal protein S13